MKLKAVLFTLVVSSISFAQAPPPSYPPAELDRLVQRVALYPDSLLAQVLSASTFPDQIPAAAAWADQHHYLNGDGLARAISDDQLPWDPSVQALLPFPSVLASMAADMNWAGELGNAVLAQRPDVMDAVQRMRLEAANYGYLRSTPQVIVGRGPFISITAVDPNFVYVPYYDPAVVFVTPRRGAVVAGISFGFGFNLGVAFRPWGWGATRIDWASHGWYVNDAIWGRNWANRAGYVHNYPGLRRFDRVRPGVAVAPHPESHRLVQRSPSERASDRRGVRRAEEHR